MCCLYVLHVRDCGMITWGWDSVITVITTVQYIAVYYVQLQGSAAVAIMYLLVQEIVYYIAWKIAAFVIWHRVLNRFAKAMVNSL